MSDNDRMFDHDLQQRVDDLTKRMELLERMTNAIEVETDNSTSNLLNVKQQIANLTRRLQLLEEK